MNRGTSRYSRKSRLLKANYISIDERSLLDRIIFTLNFAETVNLYGLQNKVTGNWKQLLEGDPAFIIADIAHTDLNSRKLSLQESISEIEEDNIEEINGIYQAEVKELNQLINNWAKRLDAAGYTGPLSQEIKGFQETWLKSEESMQSAGGESLYNDVFGNSLFIKEKAIENFEKELLLSNNHHPHVGLLLSFFKLFNHVQQDLNTFTERHLVYFYKKLLQQDKINWGYQTAMLGIQLQKDEPVLIREGEKFIFSLEENQELAFESFTNYEINSAIITDIRTIYKRDTQTYGTTSLGEDFKTQTIYDSNILTEGSNYFSSEETNVKRNPSVFGIPDLSISGTAQSPAMSELGFLISSPCLLLEDGSHLIKLTFTFTEDSFDDSVEIYKDWKQKVSGSEYVSKTEFRKRSYTEIIRKGFKLLISEEGGWRQIEHVKTILSSELHSLEVSFKLLEHHEKMVPYNGDFHGGDFETTWPCIKFLLNNDAIINPYKFLEPLVLENIEVAAEVKGVTKFALSNSIGDLDSSIPFTPFGPAPYVGSYLRMINPLIFQRHLTNLTITLDWNGLPQKEGGFEEYYKAYQMGIHNKVFKAKISNSRILEQSDRMKTVQEFELFDLENEERPSLKKIIVNLDNLMFTNKIDEASGGPKEQPSPLYFVLTEPEMAFGHQIFADIYSEVAIKRSRFRKRSLQLPKQPYTPVLEQINVDYSNKAREIMIRKRDNLSSNIKFIHLFPFGYVQQFPAPIKSAAHFIPQIEYKGHLLLGIENVRSTDVVNIGFDLEPAVYVHTTLHRPELDWQYLINNEWVAFNELLLEDTTRGLIKSGIVRLKMPNTVQLSNTLLSQGKFWIRAVSLGTNDLTSRVKNVFTQAISVMSKEENPIDIQNPHFQSRIKSISPEDDAKFGDITGPFNLDTEKFSEEDEEYFLRVSERLRHKNRAVSHWDYERLVLQQFPEVEKVKVYGRSSHPDKLVKSSSVQVVVIPSDKIEQKQGNVARKLPVYTLEDIKNYLKKFVSPYVNIEVSNAVFELIKIRCHIVLGDYNKRGQLRNKLNSELVEYLSPHFSSSERDQGFDDTISKAEIFNFIESRTYVKSVEELSILQLIEVQGKYEIIDSDEDRSGNVLKTNSPYAILGSVPQHLIRILPVKTDSIAELAYINDLSIGSDFIIGKSDNNYIENEG